MSGLFQKGKAWGWAGLIFVVCWAAGAAHAAEWFVATNGNDAADGTTWATAKLTIQAAVDAAKSKDTVWVSNGVYATGGITNYPHGRKETNRVAICKPIAVRSVNGPEETIIQGNGDTVPTDLGAEVRCVYVGTNAMLSGFTLTMGAGTQGAGAWCEISGVLSNCVLSGNSSSGAGGGSYQGKLYRCCLINNTAFGSGGGMARGTLVDCTLTSNSARYGGGAYYSVLTNCTLTGNSAMIDGGGVYISTLRNSLITGNAAGGLGGGAYSSDLANCTVTGNSAEENCGGTHEGEAVNCVVYYNTAPHVPNATGSITNSCTTQIPSWYPGNNITNEPELASASHLAIGSPCIGAGDSAYVAGTDLDGDAWLGPPSIGCDEVIFGSITGALAVSAWAAYTNMATGFPVAFRADIEGRPTASAWLWGDGSVSSNRPFATHAFASTGSFAVVLMAFNESHPAGVAATVTVQVAEQMVHYANISNPTPSAPYASWATAATNIQNAIDAVSQAGALVLVSNGTYATGGRVVNGAATNRVAIDKPITVQSANGPSVTIIKGARQPGTTNGSAAVRCAYVGTNAVMSGFTLTNGATADRGGGAWCAVYSVLTNCIVTGNSAANGGGGVRGGTLYDCILTGNVLALDNLDSTGGGARDSTLVHCTLSNNSAYDGGGAYFGVLSNCTLTANLAEHYAGGAYDSWLFNCSLTGNSAGDAGGGTAGSDLTECTLIGNTTDEGGGAFGGEFRYCTLTGNTAIFGGGVSGGFLDHCTLTANSAFHGGGSDRGTLDNCLLSGNSALVSGGGARWGTLRNCLLTGNSAQFDGGGTSSSELTNCTVSGNSSERCGGGAEDGTLDNCIVYFNTAPTGANFEACAFTTSCTTPDPGGTGNVTNDPQFVDAAAGNFRLQSNSPCINRGNNDLVQGETDLDGNPRIAYGTVDMGAYEAQFPVGYWAWAAAVTNGLTNDTDCAAGDGMPNLLKYATGGSPMDADGLARLDFAFDGGLPTLRFNRNPNATDVTLVIQGADEMSDAAEWRGLATNRNGSWSGALNVSESGQGNPIACAVQDPVPLFTNRFLRLKVTRP